MRHSRPTTDIDIQRIEMKLSEVWREGRERGRREGGRGEGKREGEEREGERRKGPRGERERGREGENKECRIEWEEGKRGKEM